MTLAVKVALNHNTANQPNTKQVITELYGFTKSILSKNLQNGPLVCAKMTNYQNVSNQVSLTNGLNPTLLN